ncbi:MAG: cell wall metabolism sensor histidine kinase WalK [Anaerolineae bacterium]|nr:cell wall metabolism sensor histidine kinase WalK [Anaerolineae bacterium]
MSVTDIPETMEALQERIEVLERESAYKQALLLTLSNAAYDALIVMNDQHEIIAINNSAEILFERQRPIGQTLIDLTGSEELDAMVTSAFMHQEEVFEEQISINRRIYRVRSEVIHRDGNQFISLALQDISDLVRLNRARRDMVANISHELRNPIANIRLLIDGLFHEQEKPKRKQSISALRAIARETDALLWMADELLDLSMIESGQAIMRMVPVPVRDIVEESIERIYDQSVAKELDVVHDVPKKLMVLCDHDKVRRVLINLLHNAVKWSPPGETITVQATSDGEEVMISVFDNGPGVPVDQTERIFERFYQVDASRSGSDGTGLGLAICKHIVEAHGGRIWAEGVHEKHKGGRFYFTLPDAGTENID